MNSPSRISSEHVVDGHHLVAEDLRDVVEDDVRHGSSLLSSVAVWDANRFVGQRGARTPVRRRRRAQDIEPEHRRSEQRGRSAPGSWPRRHTAAIPSRIRA
jgi:hypothetical protein